MSLGGSGSGDGHTVQTRKDQNWSLTTTATTADQAVGSAIPTNGKRFRIQAILIEVVYTTISTTAAHFGTITLRWGTDVILGPIQASNPSSGAPFGFVIATPKLVEVLGDGSKTVNAICTPAAVTSTVWKVSLIAYEE